MNTTRVYDENGVENQVHMNYLNVPAVPEYLRLCGTKSSVAKRIGETRAAVEALAKEKGRQTMVILNHPIWRWYDVKPEDFSFDSAHGTLSVSVAGKKSISRTGQFIVTKRDFSETPVRTVTINPADAPEDKRKVYARTHTLAGTPCGEHFPASQDSRGVDAAVSPHVRCDRQPAVRSEDIQCYVKDGRNVV